MQKVRATRAYLAGFGTAGSLLAGAAVLFVLASALVSFHGWPSVAGRGLAGTVIVRGPEHVAQPGRASTRVLVAFAHTAPRAGSATAGTVTHSVGPAADAGGVTGTGPRRTGNAGGAPVTPPTASPCGSASGSSSSCHNTLSPPSVVASTTNNVGSAVGTAGSSVGSVITGTTHQLGSTVSKVSKPLGSTVAEAGDSLSRAVTTVSQTVSGAVGQTGRTAAAAVSQLLP